VAHTCIRQISVKYYCQRYAYLDILSPRQSMDFEQRSATTSVSAAVCYIPFYCAPTQWLCFVIQLISFGFTGLSKPPSGWHRLLWYRIRWSYMVSQ